MKNNSNKTDKNQDPPKFAVKFANAVFVLGIMFSVFVISFYIVRIFSIWKSFDPTEYIFRGYSQESLYRHYVKSLIIGGISAFFLGLGLIQKNIVKVNLSLLVFTTGISVYAFEIFLEFSTMKRENQRSQVVATKQINPQQQMAEKMDIPYDTRKTIEVITDLRESGIKTYPNIFPRAFINIKERARYLSLDTLKEKLYPLGGVSKITTILGNESGYYPIIETDEHGFNNPLGLYKKNSVDIILIGDSYTEGFSVHSDENIGAVLRKKGYSALSIGKLGNGPLIELAALKEYAEPLKPKIVLWLYSENDLNVLSGINPVRYKKGDLEREFNSSVLRNYLYKDGFSQNLISRQDEIDSVLITYVNREHDREYKKMMISNIKASIKENPELSVKEIVTSTGTDELLVTQIIEESKMRFYPSSLSITQVIKLVNFRGIIALTARPKNQPKLPKLEFQTEKTFKKILIRANKMVSGWNGNMYFVYLTSFSRYSTGKEHINREFVLDTVTELDIPIIDMYTQVFEYHPDPTSLFPFKMKGHYTAEGYRLAAEGISKRLKTDGFIPSNSNN